MIFLLQQKFNVGLQILWKWKMVDFFSNVFAILVIIIHPFYGNLKYLMFWWSSSVDTNKMISLFWLHLAFATENESKKSFTRSQACIWVQKYLETSYQSLLATSSITKTTIPFYFCKCIGAVLSRLFSYDVPLIYSYFHIFACSWNDMKITFQWLLISQGNAFLNAIILTWRWVYIYISRWQNWCKKTNREWALEV